MSDTWRIIGTDYSLHFTNDFRPYMLWLVLADGTTARVDGGDPGDEDDGE
jgi:hypothetical protein